MKHTALLSSVAACICLGLVAPLLAAQLPVTGTANDPSPSEQSVPTTS